jgi:pSer/pThr/pTyr-binding forkhead associated (FHA) protein
MAKLVVLSEGLTGRSYELKVDKTTIGRVDDNTFPIAEPSVSSHHCEVLLRGNEVMVKDLGSTNGTFINGQKITESVLKPSQILRLGQVELRLESETAASAVKKAVDQTMVVPQGVKLNDLEQGPRTSGFDTTSKAFSKKSDKANLYFVIFGIIVAVIIVVLLFVVYQSIK